MPSPLGHAVAGFAVGWLASPPECREIRRTPAGPGAAAGFASRWRWPLAFAAAGVAADLDLLVGLHSRYTHSIGAALFVFAGAWFALRRRRNPVALATALALGYGSHILIDWLASDTAPPLGVMALWPFSGAFYLSPVTVFMGLSRKYWLGAAWAQNAVSVAWELVVLLPLAGAAAWTCRPRGR